MAKKYYGNGDSGIIKEDRSSFANLPQEVKMTKMPQLGYGFDEKLNDKMSGVDYQIDMDVRKMRKHEQPEKA